MASIGSTDGATVPIRLAVSGLGLVGRRHVAAIEQVAGVAIVAGVDPSPEGRHSLKIEISQPTPH